VYVVIDMLMNIRMCVLYLYISLNICV